MKQKIVTKIQDKLSSLSALSSNPALILLAIFVVPVLLCALPFEMVIIGGIKCNNKDTTKDYLYGIFLVVAGVILSAVVIFVVLSIKYALNR